MVNANLGFGTLNQNGGTSQLNGTSSAGVVNVNGGTLALGASERLADFAQLTIHGAGTLDLGANDERVDSVIVQGILHGTGTLTAAQYNLIGGTVNANLGTGVLNQNANISTLNGTSAAMSVLINSGTLKLGSSDRLADNAGVAIFAGAALDLQAFSDTVSGLGVSGGSLNGTGTLTASNYFLDGATINANLGAGTLRIDGGTSLLNGTSASDLVVINGTLSLGASDRLSDNATVYINQPGAVLDIGAFNDTINGAVIYGTLNGTGTLTASTGNGGGFTLFGGTVNANLGTGTLFSQGASVLNGTAASAQVIVFDGSLTLGGNERLANTADVQVSSGAALNIQGFNETVGNFSLSGALNGAGTLTADFYQLAGATVNANLGTGTLIQEGGSSRLNGTSAAATVTVNGGTLALGSSDRLADNALISVAAGGTLDIGAFNDTVGLLALRGTLDGTGTLTASQYQLNGATVNANLGAGTLFQLGGTSVLNGTSAAANVAVNGGTLRLGADERLANAATVVIDQAATFDLNGKTETIGTLFGGPNGAGTLALGGGRLIAGGTNADFGFGGAITGAGNIDKVGSGRFTLAGNFATTGSINALAGTWPSPAAPPDRWRCEAAI